MMLHRHGLYPYITGPNPLRKGGSADDLNVLENHVNVPFILFYKPYDNYGLFRVSVTPIRTAIEAASITNGTMAA